jgi:type II secretory pathway pseudopilin PulG
MRRLRHQDGVTLLMMLGIMAVLAILASTLVVVTANTQGGTSSDRTKKKSLNVAEAALEQTVYSLGVSWPTSSSGFAFDGSAGGTFAQQFSASSSATAEYRLPASGSFATVTLSPGPDATQYWVDAQANVGSQKSRIRALVQQHSTGVMTVVPGVALYSGGDVIMTGSAAVTGPLVNGQPSAALYAGGKVDVSGGNPSIQATIIAHNGVTQANWQHFTNSGTTVPPMSQFFPDSLVQSLTTTAKLAQKTGTLISNSTAGFSYPWGVSYSTPVYTNGDLHVNTQGLYSFGTVYVQGNLLIDGNATMNCTALYVTGTLTVGGGANTQSFGPTYVGGDVNFSGNQRFDMPLLVTGGNVTVGGSQTVGGNGVSPNPKPCMLVMTGANKSFNYSGGCRFTGVVANVGGGTNNIVVSGSNAIDGAVFASGATNLSGTGSILYDPTVVNNFTTTQTTAATLQPDTWQEVKPQ